MKEDSQGEIFGNNQIQSKTVFLKGWVQSTDQSFDKGEPQENNLKCNEVQETGL